MPKVDELLAPYPLHRALLIEAQNGQETFSLEAWACSLVVINQDRFDGEPCLHALGQLTRTNGGDISRDNAAEFIVPLRHLKSIERGPPPPIQRPPAHGTLILVPTAAAPGPFSLAAIRDVLTLAGGEPEDLAIVYQRIRRSIVAFATRESLERCKGDPTAFFWIFGTGFFVNSDGVVATNNHVLAEAKGLRGAATSKAHEFVLLSFYEHERGVSVIVLEPDTIVETNVQPNANRSLPWEAPDVGFVSVAARDTPVAPLNLETRDTLAGRHVATAGFPMGSMLMQAPGHLHQLGPTLQTGVVAAVLPAPVGVPEKFLVNVMTQGGASGSPLFLRDRAEVVGIVYAKVTEPTPTNNGGSGPSSVPTNYSLAVPAIWINTALGSVQDKLRVPTDARQYMELAAATLPKEAKLRQPARA